MLIKELPILHFPVLQMTDQVQYALKLMNDNNVNQLPIANGEVFIGSISEDDLLQADNAKATIADQAQSFNNSFVRENDHFLKGLQIAADGNLSMVPVLSESQELLGEISFGDLLKNASAFMNLNDAGALLVLEIEPHQYSFQEISRLIESNDAQIMQLNTFQNPASGFLEVTIRINKSEISDIIATFQRYDYTVKYYFGEELYENDLRSNYENLMNYLKI